MWHVIVVCDSTLRGMESHLTCFQAWIRDVTEELSSLAKPNDYYSLLVFHGGTCDIASSWLGSIMMD